MLQLISTGEYIDDNPGHGGDTYAVRVYVLRLNPFTLNEWWKSQILNHRNTYGTEEEWEAYKAGKEKPQTAFKEKVADFLKVDLSLGSLCVTQEVKFMSINIETDRMRAANAELLLELKRDIVYGEGIGYPYEWEEMAEYLPRLCGKYLTAKELAHKIKTEAAWNPGHPEIQALRAAGRRDAGVHTAEMNMGGGM